MYERSTPDTVTAVRALLPATANPAHPEAVDVTRPSDALVARAAAKATFTQLFLALGAVALLVAAVGVANTMVISVLERRSEIGLRRALAGRRPCDQRRHRNSGRVYPAAKASRLSPTEALNTT